MFKKKLSLIAMPLLVIFSLVFLPNLGFAQNRNRPPAISGITAPTVLSIGETGTWTVNASDPENGPLSYSVVWGDEDTMMKSLQAPAFVQTAEFEHAYSAPGTYTVNFTVMDDAGQTVSSNATVTVNAVADTVAPVISNEGFDASDEAIDVSWSTDEDATSKVFYGTSTPLDLGSALFVEDTELASDHSLTISDLATSTEYFIVIRSADAAGNVATSEESSVFTE